jgi:hypothetical protein
MEQARQFATRATYSRRPVGLAFTTAMLTKSQTNALERKFGIIFFVLRTGYCTFDKHLSRL